MTRLRPVAALTVACVALAMLPSIAQAEDTEPVDQVASTTGVLQRVESQQPAARRGVRFTAYPVPSQDAGVGSIVTAPNGDMWFTEEDTNRIGRITPAGVITEYDLAPTTAGGAVMDLTTSADGSIWIVYDQGRDLLRVHPDLAHATNYELGSYPYGEEVEIGPDGHPWVSMSFDYDGLARVLPTGSVWHDNAPPCDGALALNSDDTMWCQSDARVIRSNDTASGGTTFPLPTSSARPHSLAAGPNGHMWFARYFSTSFTPASNGDVGWVNRSTGKVTVRNTGHLTAPTGLVRGPDRAMWFVNLGTGRGIGHIRADGTGAITKVGDYRPYRLTFDQRGWIWFTDPANNSIVRVHPDDLRVTNVPLGPDSVLTNLSPGVAAVGTRPVRIRGGKVRLRVSCPASSRATCRGRAVVRHASKATPLTRTTGYTVGLRRSRVVVLKLTKAGRSLARSKPVRVRLVLARPDGRTVTKKIRIRR